MGNLTEAYIALGSNQGEREAMLKGAIAELHAHNFIQVSRLSSVYETDPVGYTDQPAFLNMVIQIKTSLAPLELLEAALSIEQRLGRVRLERWGPRNIDIDLLLFGEEQVKLPNLVIPHPEMIHRAFVLIPLQEVWQGVIPGTDLTIEEAIHHCIETQGVQVWGTLDWGAESERSAN
ncbi:2-amino-4-hydroxy-6-hydroxymethyldihydropteridine diphosphokinase [Brevibacillus laterosporus]|uniref:2-amino-4-hydroxy-6- hydroxymethyldihydropteridine diphosphokinase n=1 Tax=Brevibacillus laterosporus TaxID=1465 RepID=UPI000B9C0A26|nr:2-amino-4-hydroxy-6-hydroxymethyldihydropteridine diphosphokinase [Brevibacillus laterosporus]MCG7319094.1 2-amino-4-hydroxy-6-hydroxymethyldihydropteridine diphosphokinase [Brevibacillus laterosporus]